MADQARVTSIDALEAFRANLILFITKGHRSVDEVGDEVRRVRMWVQNDQRLFWEREYRRRSKLLAEAKQELMSARMSGLRESTLVQGEAVRKAKRAVDEAEEKLRNVKRWTRDFDHAIEPLMKKLDSMRQLLDHDLPKGIAFLVQAQRTLESYAGVSAAALDSPPPPPAPDDPP